MIPWRRLCILTEGQGELEITIDSESIRFQITEQSLAQTVVRVSHEDFEDALTSLGFHVKDS